MLRPIFDQSTRRDGAVDVHLARALRWWIDVLATGIFERREWDPPLDKPVHVFVDAAGKDAHLFV